MTTVTIGTRCSALAQWQAGHIRELLVGVHGDLDVRIETLQTRGDRDLETPAGQLGGKGVFTREIELALLDGTVDVAVHSLKDLPTESPDGLALAAVPTREDPADVLVAKHSNTLDALPTGAMVLTGSPRRAAQLLNQRADLRIGPIRGNVDTRMRKFDASDAAGIVFARAGLVRLGLDDRTTERFDPATFLPACGQGALAVQTRSDDDRVAALVAAIDDPVAHAAVAAERAYLAELGGGCQVPAGAYGRFDDAGRTLTLTAMLASPDGARYIRRGVGGAAGDDPLADAARLGGELAAALLADGGWRILQEAARP